FVEGMQPEVEAAVRAAVDELERLGAHVEAVSLPHTEYAIAAYYLIATAEASSNLARYDGIRYGLRAPGRLALGEMYEATRAGPPCADGRHGARHRPRGPRGAPHPLEDLQRLLRHLRRRAQHRRLPGLSRHGGPAPRVEPPGDRVRDPPRARHQLRHRPAL